MKKAWPGDRYRFVGCNCQTFAVELCEQLGLAGSIPAQYIRFAKPILTPVAELMPTIVCQQLGSQSTSGSGCCPVSSSSSRQGSDMSDFLGTMTSEVSEDVGCSYSGDVSGHMTPIPHPRPKIDKVQRVSGRRVGSKNHDKGKLHDNGTLCV